ncbi:MAG: hypothetical protein PHC28_09315 [Flavobacterium sp.]|uniref:hypothetical protein n=1 Tax=Flavobacterium sp. TaxID=239 RepID=UPI0026045F56|nr:hypothetical protein [Flavobacterium sp.]MDD5150668.1 hypothetical protein [Flavobacterium sp.]
MTPQELYTELVSGPLANEIAPHIISGNDAIIEAIINRKDISIHGSIPMNIFMVWLGSTNLRAVVEDHCTNLTSPLRSIALIIKDYLQGNNTAPLNMGLSDTQNMMYAWVQAGAITSLQYVALFNLSLKNISRAEQLGYSITISDIATALRG